jgi:hypothetical protein
LAVVLGIGTGLTLAGIPGALLAVPLLAIANASIRSLLSPADAGTDPQSVDVNDAEEADPPGESSHSPTTPLKELPMLRKSDRPRT